MKSVLIVLLFVLFAGSLSHQTWAMCSGTWTSGEENDLYALQAKIQSFDEDEQLPVEIVEEVRQRLVEAGLAYPSNEAYVETFAGNLSKDSSTPDYNITTAELVIAGVSIKLYRELLAGFRGTVDFTQSELITGVGHGYFAVLFNEIFGQDRTMQAARKRKLRKGNFFIAKGEGDAFIKLYPEVNASILDTVALFPADTGEFVEVPLKQN